MKRALIAVAVIILLVLCWWFYVARIGATSIADITRNPRGYEGKSVTIAGEVTERANLLLVRYFVVQDKTGAIPIVTDRILPAVKSSVRVSGRVREAFSLGDQQVLVLEEQSEKSRQ